MTYSNHQNLSDNHFYPSQATSHQREEVTQWVNLVAPSRDEKQLALSSINLSEDSLNHFHGNLKKLSGDVTLLKLEIPRVNLPTSKIPYHTGDLTIIVKEGLVISLGETDSYIFTHMDHEYLAHWSSQDSTEFTYQLLLLVTKAFSNLSDILIHDMERLEAKLKHSFNNKSVYKLINYNKSLLLFAKALQKNILLMEKLEKLEDFNRSEALNKRLNDLIAHTQHARAVAQTYQANMRNMMDAYSALIENNLSLSVQYLTILVTVATFPMAIGGIYGMNTPLPAQDNPFILPLLGIICIGLIISALLFFKAKKLI